MVNQSKTPEDFLKSFTEEILRIKSIELKKPERKFITLQKPIMPYQEVKEEQIITPSIKPSIIKEEIQTKSQPLQVTAQPRILAPIPINIEEVFGKISNLIASPEVQTLECPGPNKNLLVTINGKVQATAETLSAKEIDSLLKSISAKTRIPMIGRIFKASFDNYKITAIISQYSGTRFIITKSLQQN